MYVGFLACNKNMYEGSSATGMYMLQKKAFHVNFYEPREGKLGGFFTFRESEKTKKKTPGSTFFAISPIGSKKG
jgi:hypothetical protein